MTRATIAIAAALAATLSLAGCSGDDTKKNTPEEGPLSKYLSALYDQGEWTKERMAADHKKTEKIVAECMTKEGFEYRPVPFEDSGMSFEVEDDGPQMGTVKFAKQYGYGLVDSPWMQTAEEQEQAQPKDPNQKYLESLSESEQMAYSETLYGPGPTAEEMEAMESEDGGSYQYDWKKSGCQGKAQHEVQGEQSYDTAAKDPAYAELLKSIDDFWQKQSEGADETIKALDRKWSDCMTKAGFADSSTRADASTKLSDEWTELQNQGQPENATEWKEPSKEVKQKFQKREIEVAVADATCAEKMQYDDKLAAANLRAEQKFVDQHEKQLKALVAQYGAKKK